MIFHRRPPSGVRLPLPDRWFRRDQGLPDWASSSDFRDFEDGADNGVQLLGNEGPKSVEGVLAAQTADGIRDAQAGVEQAGWLVQKFKPQILDQAKRSGLKEQDAQYAYERLDEMPTSFFWKHRELLDPNVTPNDDRTYRELLGQMVPDPEMRQRFLEAYEKRFKDGTLRRGR